MKCVYCILSSVIDQPLSKLRFANLNINSLKLDHLMAKE